MKIEKTTKKNHSQELLPQIIERIFAICRSDPNFHLKDELEIVENKIQALKQKSSKQDSLIEQSFQIKKDFLYRIEILDEQNSVKQVELLESIGSEL